MKTLIKNGRVVTAVDDYVADIFIDGETVTTIGKSLDMEANFVIGSKGRPRRLVPLNATASGILRAMIEDEQLLNPASPWAGVTTPLSNNNAITIKATRSTGSFSVTNK